MQALCSATLKFLEERFHQLIGGPLSPPRVAYRDILQLPFTGNFRGNNKTPNGVLVGKNQQHSPRKRVRKRTLILLFSPVTRRN